MSCCVCASAFCASRASHMLTAASCNKEFCFKHSNAHDGVACAEYERQHKAEEAANQAAIAAISKPCPRCGAPVMKKSTPFPLLPS